MRWGTLSTIIISGGILIAGCEDDGNPTGPGPLPEPGEPGFRTAEPAFARALAGASVTPIFSVGDRATETSEPMAPGPDGIGVRPHGGQLLLYVSHELHGVPTTGGGVAYDRGRVSRAALDTETLDILSYEFLIDGSEGYRAFSTGVWVDEEDGFPGGFFFTGEKVHNGVQLAIDRDDAVIEMPWLGRYQHDSQISVPGFPNHVVLLNFEDNGGQVDAQSELYMYVASSVQAAITGGGQLYAFRSGEVGDVGELTPGASVGGGWIAIPADVVEDDEALQTFVDGQGALSFVRLEDGFYDKRPGASPAAYFFDTGRTSITNGSGNPLDRYGSIYRIAFGDPADPAGGSATLTLLARSDGPETGWASPDNGDMRADGVIMLQEDPAAGSWSRAPGIFRLQVAADGSLVDPAGTQVAEVVDPACPEGGCSSLRVWEMSGITDVSRWLGPGRWLFTVMAHDKPVPALDLTEENGQLLLLEDGT